MTEKAPGKLEELAALFPDAVRNITGDDGTLQPVVDLALIAKELPGHTVIEQPEQYELTWPGKQQAITESKTPSWSRLVPEPEKSVNFETTDNLFIAGDNLEALKLLWDTHAGDVDFIYIDPPYNTGNSFVYTDKFSVPTSVYSARSGDQRAQGRFHADWLNMMYPRLLLARELLSEDGVGFVSIDANELAHLKLMIGEIFGAENLFSTIVWVSNLKGRQISGAGPAGTHEYILCFARDATTIRRFRGSAAKFQQLMPAIYRGRTYEIKHDANGPYVTKNWLHNTNSRFNEQTAPTMVFRIHFNPDTGEVRVSDIDDDEAFPGFLTAMPHPNAQPGLSWHAWRWSRQRVVDDRDELEFDTTGGRLRIRTKIRDVDGMTLKDVILGPATTTGQADLEALGMRRMFETPKPVELIKLLLSVAAADDALVLDFFAGSGSTAEAVMNLNAEDDGARRFIMVQLDEPCAPGSPAAKAGFSEISALCGERMKRAGNKIAATTPGVDVGFRRLRLG